LLVRIEPEGGGVSPSPRKDAILGRTDRFAGVFDDEYPMPPCGGDDGRQFGRSPEDVHGQDGAETPGWRERLDGLDRLDRIHRERLRIDVDEDRGAALEQNGIR